MHVKSIKNTRMKRKVIDGEDSEDDFIIDPKIVVFNKITKKFFPAYVSSQLWTVWNCLGNITAVIDGDHIARTLPMFGFRGNDYDIYEIVAVETLDQWRKKVELYDEFKKQYEN